MSPKHVLVAVGWPYASGSRHLGHLAGAYLPADIFARYHRTQGDEVLMVSGSDVHGTPITVRADQEGVDPQVIVDRYHQEFLDQWDDLGISWNLYTATGTDNHREVTWDLFLRLKDRGYITQGSSQQFYDPEADRFLPDRYVEGKCPHCGYEAARGDQCENCGRTLDPEDLINPKSRITGATPEMRETEHYFLRLSAFQDQLLEWLKSREGWRKHVQNWAIGFVEEGLIDRAITRDLTWGVPVPVDDLGPGKRIYVWFEAVIGYLSASKEWAQRQGDREAWRAWWEDPEAVSYYFVGKDNIPFHTIIWPAMLMGYGGLNLPTNVPANQFVTFSGAKGSASRGVGRPIGWYTEHLEADAIRYALAANLPEHNDTDLTEAELVRRINEELVATWGNLVNRVVALTHQNFGGKIPTADPASVDQELLAKVDAALGEVGRQIEAVELRAGLRAAMQAAQQVNIYLNRTEPWKTGTDDPDRTGTTLNTALSAISGLAVAFAPYLPFSSARVSELLSDGGLGGWKRPELTPGAQIDEIDRLFAKAELGED
ncbi:MAG: methionine--tRNA ligase [Acidimicrobiia bacterium]